LGLVLKVSAHHFVWTLLKKKYRGGRLQGLARNMSGLSTFFYFVACPIFSPKICRLSSFEQKFFSLYQQKMFVKTSI